MIVIVSGFFLLIVSNAFSAEAELYKGLDEEGNIVYSDKPSGKMEKIIPPSLTIFDPPKITTNVESEASNTVEETAKEFKYTDFDIVSPRNDETIWNDPNPTVTLSLKPDLNTSENHTIWLLIDKKPLLKNTRETTLHLGYVNRGAHLLQAQVRDKNNKILARTRAIVIYVKHASVQKQPR